MNHRGFTLLEVLVALTILLVGILATANLFTLSLIQANLSAAKTMATITASSKLAVMRAGGKANFDNWLENNTYHLATVEESEQCLCSGWCTSVSLISDNGQGKLYRVTMTIVSLDGREETFVTYFVDVI